MFFNDQTNGKEDPHCPFAFIEVRMKRSLKAQDRRFRPLRTPWEEK